MAMVTGAGMENPKAHRGWAGKQMSEGVYNIKLIGTVFSYTD